MTPDQKRDAWLKLMTAFVVSSEDSAPEGCATLADQALALLEQREREGQFGAEEVPPPAGYSLKGWANPNAVKRMEKELADLQTNRDEWMERAHQAGAEVERLKAEVEAAKGGQGLFAKALADESERADKAESLLKEALGALRAWQAAWQQPSGEFANARIAANAATEPVLTRARKEGFDGE